MMICCDLVGIPTGTNLKAQRRWEKPERTQRRNLRLYL
jgi:hypothetical protein